MTVHTTTIDAPALAMAEGARERQRRDRLAYLDRKLAETTDALAWAFRFNEPTAARRLEAQLDALIDERDALQAL